MDGKEIWMSHVPTRASYSQELPANFLDGEEQCGGTQRRAILTHREKINSFLRTLNLYKSKSLEVAFKNPPLDTDARNFEKLLNFVSRAVAYTQSQKKGVFQDHAVCLMVH